MRTAPALLVAALLAAPAAASAQHYAPRPSSWRDSWYIGFGLGTGGGSYVLDGQRVNYRDHHGGASPFQAAFQFELGATVTPHLLLGGEISGLTSHASDFGADTTLTVSQVLAVATFFPMERGLFFRGGAGFAAISSDFDDGFTRQSASANGVGVLGGVGYAWWLGRRFNLTLHTDLSAQSYGSRAGLPSSSAGLNAYLGFRWY